MLLVEPAGDAANVLLLAPVEHHLGEGRVELDLSMRQAATGSEGAALAEAADGGELNASSCSPSSAVAWYTCSQPEV